MDSVLDLIAVQKARDGNGVWRTRETAREVFCRVGSVTRREFHDAGRNGLNPELKFTVFAGDYNGETLIGYEGRSYAVYRTYYVPGTDDLEIYVRREGGANGKENTGGNA